MKLNIHFFVCFTLFVACNNNSNQTRTKPKTDLDDIHSSNKQSLNSNNLPKTDLDDIVSINKEYHTINNLKEMLKYIDDKTIVFLDIDGTLISGTGWADKALPTGPIPARKESESFYIEAHKKTDFVVGLTARYYFGDSTKETTTKDISTLLKKPFSGFGKLSFGKGATQPNQEILTFHNNCLFSSLRDKGQQLKMFLKQKKVIEILKQKGLNKLVFVDDSLARAEQVNTMLQNHNKSLGILDYNVFHCPPSENR